MCSPSKWNSLAVAAAAATAATAASAAANAAAAASAEQWTFNRRGAVVQL